jgi:hypothetical protein
MLLRGENGDSLALRISGYQFPEAEDLVQRYSWHMIEGGASCGPATWSFRHPALTCCESVRLGAWLKQAADGIELNSVLEFTEPNLRFEIVGQAKGAVILEVRLAQEFRQSPDPVSGKRDSVVLTLQLSDRAVRIAADEWGADVDRFPDVLAE